MPRKLGKFGQKMHKNLYTSNLFDFWNYIAKNIFSTANIGRGETQIFHIPKWSSCEGSAAFTQNIPQGGEVHRPATGCMKPCRNGVINKKEAVRMLLDDYSSILQQPLLVFWIPAFWIPVSWISMYGSILNFLLFCSCHFVKKRNWVSGILI